MKKLNAFGMILGISALLSVAGVIVYLVNTNTGYMAGKAAVAPLVVVLPILCVACAAVLVVMGDKLPSIAVGAATLLVAVLMAWATTLFITERVDVIGDMLNPVNHPGTQVTAVIWSIVGIALYFLSFLGSAVSTLSSSLTKKN